MNRRAEENSFRSWVALSSPSSSVLLTCVRVAEFDNVGVSGFSVPEFDVPAYGRSLGRLDKILDSIEQYIHIAFVRMKKYQVMMNTSTSRRPMAATAVEVRSPTPRS
jgi:hypothetical protein